MAKPFLPCHPRFKNGKDHCSWSIAEKGRTARGRVQRHILYLGEINDSQREAWTKVTDVFDTARDQTRPRALYPADRAVPEHASEYGVQVRLGEFVLRRPRQWGPCWVGCKLWDQLQLEEFWRWRWAESKDRVNKERSMRRRQLKGLWKRFKELAQMDLSPDQLLFKLGAAKHQYPAAWRLVAVTTPEESPPIAPPNFRFELRKDKLRLFAVHLDRFDGFDGISSAIRLGFSRGAPFKEGMQSAADVGFCDRAKSCSVNFRADVVRQNVANAFFRVIGNKGPDFIFQAADGVGAVVARLLGLHELVQGFRERDPHRWFVEVFEVKADCRQERLGRQVG